MKNSPPPFFPPHPHLPPRGTSPSWSNPSRSPLSSQGRLSDGAWGRSGPSEHGSPTAAFSTCAACHGSVVK
ncbi:hypothetical protein XA68_16499 [Ophiocordyceps unilateralis]|uniref:Uncharacterized protein n=1 Tax=Ophiocordyceps unilateralis TaxID=268505 RepID=A0A2A9PK09_OPHUN|nr:hypothetical protein XA68_16499 [Ophiocordyceps unilateralis]